jgi:regulator of replication initiation timing
MFDELNELAKKNEQLEQENRELRRLSFQNKIQLLQSKITNLQDFVKQNRANWDAANNISAQGLVDGIDTSVYSNAIISANRKITELEREIRGLERQLDELTEQNAVIQIDGN